MDKYYEQYLKDHANPKVKLAHFIGQLVTILYPIWVIYFKYWWLLLFTPFVIYPFAVGGHILFGDKENRPSFCKMSFLRAKWCDIKMFVDILRGKFKVW